MRRPITRSMLQVSIYHGTLELVKLTQGWLLHLQSQLLQELHQPLLDSWPCRMFHRHLMLFCYFILACPSTCTHKLHHSIDTITAPVVKEQYKALLYNLFINAICERSSLFCKANLSKRNGTTATIFYRDSTHCTCHIIAMSLS